MRELTKYEKIVILITIFILSVALWLFFGAQNMNYILALTIATYTNIGAAYIIYRYKIFRRWDRNDWIIIGVTGGILLVALCVFLFSGDKQEETMPYTPMATATQLPRLGIGKHLPVKITLTKPEQQGKLKNAIITPKYLQVFRGEVYTISTKGWFAKKGLTGKTTPISPSEIVRVLVPGLGTAPPPQKVTVLQDGEMEVNLGEWTIPGARYATAQKSTGLFASGFKEAPVELIIRRQKDHVGPIPEPETMLADIIKATTRTEFAKHISSATAIKNLGVSAITYPVTATEILKNDLESISEFLTPESNHEKEEGSEEKRTFFNDSADVVKEKWGDFRQNFLKSRIPVLSATEATRIYEENKKRQEGR